MTTNRTKTSAPTDLELMLYADGELEGERLAAVEAHLAEDETAQRKLLGLGMVSAIVRERALEPTPAADGLADSIMASIEAEAGAPAVRALEPIKQAEVVALQHRARRPSNDNARGFFAIAVVAVAAAAALLFWGRTATPPVGTGPLADRTAPTVLTVQAPPEDDVRHGVEVAAVDFGARTGLVFYVPTGLSASSTTTVVWLSDDSSGGSE